MILSHCRNVINPLLYPTLNINLEYKLTFNTDSDFSSIIADSEYSIKSQTEEVKINYIVFIKKETLNRSQKQNYWVYYYKIVVVDKSTKKKFFWCKLYYNNNISKFYATFFTNYIIIYFEKSYGIIKLNIYNLYCNFLTVTFPHKKTFIIFKIVVNKFWACLII